MIMTTISISDENKIKDILEYVENVIVPDFMDVKDNKTITVLTCDFSLYLIERLITKYLDDNTVKIEKTSFNKESVVIQKQ